MIINSPVARFPGTVNRPEFLTLPQVLAVESTLRELSERGAELKRAEIDIMTMKAVLPLYTDWHIEGIPAEPTIDTFPATPRVASAQLIAWLLGEVMKVYTGEIDIPNA